ncbi:MAG: hypothetical protein GY853_06370 [PVC group bacterium]|nr:hypothetical protein [PVC group bacterium]
MVDNDKEKEAMRDREYVGNTVEEAIATALADLKLPKEKVKIQILTEGQRGLFGMKGAKQAKIRVTILPEESPQ